MLAQIDESTMPVPVLGGLRAGSALDGVVALLAETPQAPCFDADPNLFFAEAPADIDVAKALCGPCGSRRLCLAGAMLRREPHGVWGGELFSNGQVIAQKRPRGRPRKQGLEAPLVAVTPATPQASDASEAA